jgi:hypothetical protein
MRLPWTGRTHAVDRGAIVDAGRVNCPYRGDIDVELCVDCPRLDGVDDSGDAWRIRCTTPNRMLDLAIPWPVMDRN